VDHLERLLIAATDERSGNRVSADELIRMALDALVGGVDTPALRELAGLTRSEEPAAHDLFEQVIHELGLAPSLPELGHPDALRPLVGEVARQLLEHRSPGFVVERLRLDHAAALLAFERENRAYFAASVPDRGDDYFAHFDERHRALLDEQDAGHLRFHLVVGDGGEVLGRVNLVDIADGSAELGFRVAEKASGRGLATAAVREVCALAELEYGLARLGASAAVDNGGSRAVLRHAGFVATGEEVALDGRAGLRYRLVLGRR